MKEDAWRLIPASARALLAAVLLALAWSGPLAAQERSGGGALAPAVPVGTGFTYQGRLENNGVPAGGDQDFRFQLFDSATLGAAIGPTLTLDNVFVTGGYFTAPLDFGAGAFGGGRRWLEIAVRPGASAGAYTTLAPRQEITPAPYALALPNVYTDESANFVGVGRNFRISGNEVFGIRYTGNANQYGGMYVETSAAGGWPFYGYATNGSFRAWTYYDGTTGEWSLNSAGKRLKVPSSGGLRIGPAVDYSLVIENTTGPDGIRVLDTGDDAIQIGSNPDIPNYGVYIPSPGVSTYGLWSNTSNAQGEWALYTVDNISVGAVLAPVYSLLAKVTGFNALTLGDVVAVAGMSDPVPGGQPSLPQVVLADDTQATGVIGVVEKRMVWAPAPGKDEYSLQGAKGPADPGEYVSLVVYGVAQVKVNPGATISAGERVTASNLSGQVRGLQTRTIDGMVVTEGAQTIGIALEVPTGYRDTIPVFVTLR